MLRESRYRWFLAVWLLAAAAAVWLYMGWGQTRNCVGIVEAAIHAVGARESGIIREMLVAIEDEVRKGQVLAVLDTSDIDEELTLLNQQLRECLALEAADRSRSSIELQRLRLQLDNESSGLTTGIALLESKRIELAGLEAEIERLETAKEAGLGHSSELSGLILQRDALRAFLGMQEREFELARRRAESAEQSEVVLDAAGDQRLVDSMQADSAERIAEIRRSILAAQTRRNGRNVLAPCDGCVVDLYARAGDTIPEFSPILAVMEREAHFLDVFIPPRIDLPLQEGMPVSVLPFRASVSHTAGQVSFIHPGYRPVPERLGIRGQAQFARTVRVRLDPEHELLPGEIVQVRIGGGRGRDSSLAGRARAEASPATPDRPGLPPGTVTGEIHLPARLAETSRFEPSGIGWLPEIRRYIIASDDTGLAGGKNDHDPLLFLMKEDGQVDPEPVLLRGVGTLNDVEAIAPAGRDLFYLVSSQSCSRKGKRRADRRMLLEVRRDEGGFHVDRRVSLIDLLMSSCSEAELRELGLSRAAADGLPLLNIEGAAWRDGTLYLGLKQPITDRGAILWRLEDLEGALRTGRLLPGQLSLHGIVDLGRHEGRRRGISDLAFDERGRLWALSTIPEVPDDQQMGGLHRIDRFADGRLESARLLDLPGRKPEGLCFPGGDAFCIVIDAGAETSTFLRGDLSHL